MSPAEILSSDLAQAAKELRDADQPFAFATIVRTVGTTAAKPGAKALLSEDGAIIHGWLGGGCTRGAVKRAAIVALRDGTPQLISVAPEELLAQRGVSAGDDVDGTTFASNGCPSKGTVDIFIEPCSAYGAIGRFRGLARSPCFDQLGIAISLGHNVDVDQKRDAGTGCGDRDPRPRRS